MPVPFATAWSASRRVAWASLSLVAACALVSACQPATPEAPSATAASAGGSPSAVGAPTAPTPSVTAEATPATALASADAARNPEKAPPAEAQVAEAAPEAPQLVLGLLATAAGLHAMGEHCGQLKADARTDALARLKTRWVGSGEQQIRADVFDRAYQASYAETQRRIGAAPERAKQACGELPALEQQAQKALEAMGRAPKS